MYDEAEKEGERFEERLRLALCRVLVSPHFLFRVELDPPACEGRRAYQISELELASRLSYFLWSRMPDDELFELALRGELRKQSRRAGPADAEGPEVARAGAELRRPVAHASASCDLSAPDPKLFPHFDDDLRSAMIRETELFFEDILREDRSILDLLDADFTFVNARLAKHYGIDGVYGARLPHA